MGGARRRFTRQLVLGLLVVGGLVLVVAKVPGCMLEHAQRSADECFDRYDRTKRGELSACRRDGWLAIPELAPHTRARAEAERASVDDKIEYRVLSAATTRASTAADRERARASIAASSDGPGDKARAYLDLGAYEEAAKLPVDADPELQLAQLDATLLAGDFERALALLQKHTADRAHGALACVRGARERGIAILAAADRAARGRGLSGTGLTRIAATVCGATAEAFGADPTAAGELHHGALLFARLFDPAFHANRRAAVARWLREDVTIFGHIKLGAHAIAIAATPETDTFELLKLVTGRHAIPLEGLVALTPWAVLGTVSYSDSDLDFIPPSWFAAAATRMRAALARPPAKIRANAWDLDDIPEAAIRDPHALFRRVAVRLDALAAMYALRAGRRDEAMAAIERLRTDAPASIDLAVLELAAGAPQRALDVLARFEQTATAEDRIVALVPRTLAHAALGDHEAAHAAAVAGLASKSPVFDWLALATAITAKRPFDGLPIGRSEREPGDAAAWAEVLAKPTKDVPFRHDFDAEVVLPAVYVVVGHAATVAGGDAEHFLDHVYRSAGVSRSSLRARAEAARWLGNTESARRWDERATRLEQRFRDDRTMLLAGIARLW